MPWLFRIAWVALVPAAGGAIANALDERSEAVRTTAAVGLWAAWAIVLCASLVLHPISLTTVRLAAPAALIATAAAGGVRAIPGVVAAAAACMVALMPEFGFAYVNGPAYPNERRFPLRPPGPLRLGPLQLAAAITVGAPTTGALLLAAKQWIVGAVVLVVGIPAAILLGRALHGLSRRWCVFVPAGIVLHDPMTLADPVLIRRHDISGIGPALADTEAVDLTARAFGLAVQIDLATPMTLALVRAGSRVPQRAEATAVLFAPTRPGAVLHAVLREGALRPSLGGGS